MGLKIIDAELVDDELLERELTPKKTDDIVELVPTLEGGVIVMPYPANYEEETNDDKEKMPEKAMTSENTKPKINLWKNKKVI